MMELEHVNVTVTDAHATAAWHSAVFGWKIRWEGASMNGAGYTIHSGTENSYVALYQPQNVKPALSNNYTTAGGLNHIAVVVDDLDKVENAVTSAGFKTMNHGDYEPGRRFYFLDGDGIEYEIVSYP